MPENNAVLMALALAKRAGKLTAGFDAVMKAAAAGEAKAVVASRELSPKTLKEAAFQCGRYQVPLLQAGFSLEQAERVLGKRAGIYSVNDEQLVRLVQKKTGYERSMN